jgi:hypothetical protein
MPLFAARTRYSLVKGERIVRFVLTAWLRDLFRRRLGVFISSILHYSFTSLPCGTKTPSYSYLAAYPVEIAPPLAETPHAVPISPHREVCIP